MISAQPQLAPVLGPMWARMKDLPESDKIARLLLAMAPPAVQALESEEDDIPPQAQQKIQQLESQLQEMHQMIDMASSKLEEANSKTREIDLKWTAEAAKIENEQYALITDRIKAMATGLSVEQLQPVIQQLIQEAMANPLEDPQALEDAAGMPPEPGEQMLQEPPEPQEMQPPGQEPAEMNEPPQGGFSLPEPEVNE